MATRERKRVTKKNIDKPNNEYVVVMYNDDTTDMLAVTIILMSVFDYSRDSAVDLMLQIHNSDKCVVGIYTEKIAKAKRNLAIEMARNFGFSDFTVKVEQV